MSENEYTVTEILCDQRDCGEGIEDIDSTVPGMRRNAVRDGWRCDESGDWCPEHASEAVA